MKLPASYFSDYLSDIRMTEKQRRDAADGHKRLRERLTDDDKLSSRIISSFIQGSYKRSTAVRPKNGKRSDVDVVVVTNLHESDYTPDQAIDLFIPFCEKHYKGKYEKQGRSIGIELSTVELDLVITSAPSESQLESLRRLDQDTSATLLSLLEEDKTIEDVSFEDSFESWFAKAEQAQWKLEPLRIPDRDAECWQDTHPLEQINWTVRKNAACNTHYINVVKAIKWWQRINNSVVERPKGYPLEHIIGDCCPNAITAMDEGVLKTFEEIVSRYQSYADTGQVPYLPDRGVANNVLARITPDEFTTFHREARKAADLARKAWNAEDICETVEYWRELFGDKFPKPPASCNESSSRATGGYTKRENRSEISGGRYA